MSNNNNIKIFDGLVSKTKAYLIIIAILLIALCFFEIKLIIPSIIIYFLILVGQIKKELQNYLST